MADNRRVTDLCVTESSATGKARPVVELSLFGDKPQ